MPEYEINVVQKMKGKVGHQWSKGRTCEKKCKKRYIIVVQWPHVVYVVHEWPVRLRSRKVQHLLCSQLNSTVTQINTSKTIYPFLAILYHQMGQAPKTQMVGIGL